MLVDDSWEFVLRHRLIILTSLVLVLPLLGAVGLEKPAEARTKPRVTLSVGAAPIAQTPGGHANRTVYRGKVTPARKGAKVFLERRNSAGRWHVVARTTQDRRGAFSGRYVALARSREVLRVRSKPARTSRLVSSPLRVRRTPALVFGENFSGKRLNTARWRTRHQPFTGRRQCAKPGSRQARLLGDGKLTLSVRKLDNRNRAKCRHGRWLNGMIGSKGRFGHGFFAARVKFQNARGMHGAFWLQGPAVTGAEIDIAEYFGAAPRATVKQRQHRLGTLIHYTDKRGRLHSYKRIGSQLPTARILGKRRTPGNSYHVYAVHWTPSRYRFYLDGQLMFSTKRPFVSRAPSEIVLSLLSSDYELKHLKSPRSVVKVDWVRHWRSR